MERSRTYLVLLITAGVLVVLGVGIALAALPPGGTFIDDDGNVHEGNIEAIAAEGITRGCNPSEGNTKYCPASDLNRGQMAAFIRRALNLPATTTDYFDDDNDSIFEGDINALAEAGITKGCNPTEGNTKFCPEGKVRREVMAAFLRRAFAYPASTTDFFSDDNDSIFEADINAIAEAGVTKGCNPSEGNTKYCPTSLVKRDQMASFFARALGLDPITPGDTTTTTDPGGTTITTMPTPTTTTTTTIPSWTEPVGLRSSDTYLPRVDADGDSVTAAWQDRADVDPYLPVGTEVYIRRSSDGGQTWTDLQNVSNTVTLSESDVEVAISLGTTVVTWWEDETDDILIAALDGDSVTRTRIDRVSWRRASTPRLVGTGDLFYYVSGGTYPIFMASADAGASWSDPIIIQHSFGPSLAIRPESGSVVADGLDVVVVGVDYPSSEAIYNDVFAFHSTDGGATWSDSTNLSATTAQEWPAEVVARGDTVVAAWCRTLSSSTSALVVAVSSDFGSTWSPSRDVAEVGRYQCDEYYERPVPVARSDRFEILMPWEALRITSVDGHSWTPAVPPHEQGIGRVSDGATSDKPTTYVVGTNSGAAGIGFSESLD